jgi:hypothetical protein
VTAVTASVSSGPDRRLDRQATGLAHVFTSETLRLPASYEPRFAFRGLRSTILRHGLGLVPVGRMRLPR